MFRVYISCPHCGRHSETRHAFGIPLLLYSLGSPHKCCPSCFRLYATRKKEWSEFGRFKRYLFVLFRVPMAIANGAIFGFLASLVFRWSIYGVPWFAVVIGIACSLIIIHMMVIEIRESRIRDKMYRVRDDAANILAPKISYYRLLENLGRRTWLPTVEVALHGEEQDDWMDVVDLLHKGGDANLCSGWMDS